MKHKTSPRAYIPRKEYRFWLRKDRDEDTRLMEFIQFCKSTRQFARVVKDGIWLIWSLKEDNLDVLFELFPHLENRFKRAAGQGDSGEMQRQISAAVAQGVQQAMMELPAPPAGYPMMKAPVSEAQGAAPLAAVKAAALADASTIADNFLDFIQ